MWVSHEWDTKSSNEWDSPIHDFRGIFLRKDFVYILQAFILTIIMKFEKKEKKTETVISLN